MRSIGREGGDEIAQSGQSLISTIALFVHVFRNDMHMHLSHITDHGKRQVNIYHINKRLADANELRRVHK